MSERIGSCARDTIPDDLDRHLATFCEALEAAGYAETSKRQKRYVVGQFAAWLRGARVSTSGVDESVLCDYLARGKRRDHGFEQTALRQFLGHLRDARAAPPRDVPSPLRSEVRVLDYLDHLRDRRGLSARSRAVYSPFVRAFVESRLLGGDPIPPDARAVRAYLLERARGRSVSYVRLLTAALRSFLHFLFFEGETPTDLATSVPPVRRWGPAAPPPFLTAEEVDRVLAATDRSTPRGRRAFAILLLLARLGLRAGEVAALDLDDLHWGQGEVVVRGKGRRRDRLPLPEDVGEALAVYLREARGPSASRRVFLRLHAPRTGLSGPSAICVVAREALRRAGLRPVGRVAAHVFRHSLATRMIRRGASLGEISQILRHRSIDSTRLYARVEIEALRGVALAWPTREARG